LAPIGVVLGWLLLVFAADRTGMISLQDEARFPPANATGAGGTVEFFVDARAALSRAEVARLPPQAWQRWSGKTFITSPGRTPLWLRVTLRNPAGVDAHGVLANGSYYFVDRVEGWVGAGPNARHVISGEAVPVREKALWGRDTALPIVVPARGEQVVYLRAQDVFASIMTPVWWPEQAAFHAAQARGWLAEGIHLGGLLALLGYNMVLWLRLRLRDIGYYSLYLGANALFILLGRAHLASFGVTLGSPGLEALLVADMTMSGFFLTQFARVFLDLEARSARMDRLARGLAIAMLALAVGGFALSWLSWLGMQAAVFGVGVAHVLVFALALWSWRAGERQARFFVLSFGCFFAGSLPTVVVWFTDVSFKDVTLMGLLIGTALEMLLLSLATADRFVQAQREKAAAQEQLVEETEQRRAIQEAYADELEEEVRERTRELEQANADKDRILAVMGHDLRSPLTGLMQAADQATGDFAREAARTGRALLLMIEDLVLWARLRAGTRVVSDHSAQSLLVPAIALHRALAERDGTELIVEGPEGLRVETDLVLAQTLVRNLLANALKFAATRVVLRAEEDGVGGVRFTVGNDGPSLSLAIAARLAAGENEPMTATGGLGLRLCREICRALGIRLQAGAAAAGGTEFTFTLKTAAPAAVARS
jgi:signal transduction histidine kinase